MDVKERIERICKRKNTKYSDFRNTIYYYSFLDLISRSEENISDEDIISNARIYSISLLERNKNIDSKDLELFKEILESKNEAVVELTMSVIAIVDNMEYFPHDALKLLHKMAIQDENHYTRKDYEHLNHAVVGTLESLSANYGEEKWGIPYEDELVEILSIRSNAYERYMQVLDEASEPHYTDFATILSPFVKTPPYAHNNNKMGVLCVLKGPEYAILDPHTNDVNYTIISGAVEAGLRPKYKYNSKKPPKNEGYVSTDSKITEFGYWPKDAVSVSKQIELDNNNHKKRLVGSITTGISFINGKPIRKLADCYEYKGEIYTCVPAEFINGMGGDQILSNNGLYRNGDLIWTKFEPLKCYVDKKTKNIITTDIIMSGIDVGLLYLYFNDYFTEELHQFDVFYQCKRRNLEKKPIPLSKDRIRLIKQINQMIDTPDMSVDDESLTDSEEENNKDSSQIKINERDSKLIEAINAYFDFDKENIDISRFDDYVRLFKAIIEQLKLQNEINEETITCLQELIQPLDELTDSNKRIRRILNGGGPGEKIASDGEARQMIKDLIPMTDQIVNILSQEYKTEYYYHNSSGNKITQLKDERSRFEDLISIIKDSNAINEVSYILLNSLNKLIALCCDFLQEDELKKSLQDIAKPLGDMLNVNNRIVSLINFADSIEFTNNENTLFIENVLAIYNLLNPIIEVIYEDNNIDIEPVDKEKTKPNNTGLFGGIARLFSGVNPFENGNRDNNASSSNRQEKSNSNDANPKANTNSIMEASLEDAMSILKIYSGASKRNDLIAFKELLECGDYSFDIGRINNLLFIVLKNQNDDTTYVYTNNHLGEVYKFGFDGKRISWERNYWEGEKKHTLNITKRMDRIPSQKQVRYTIKRFKSGVSSEEIVRQEKYDEKNNSVSVEDEEGTEMFTYDINEHGLWRLRQHEASNIFIEAINHDIEYYVSSEMMSIIKFFSPKISQQIQNSDRIFNDEDEGIPK